MRYTVGSNLKCSVLGKVLFRHLSTARKCKTLAGPGQPVSTFGSEAHIRTEASSFVSINLLVKILFLHIISLNIFSDRVHAKSLYPFFRKFSAYARREADGRGRGYIIKPATWGSIRGKRTVYTVYMLVFSTLWKNTNQTIFLFFLLQQVFFYVLKSLLLRRLDSFSRRS